MKSYLSGFLTQPEVQTHVSRRHIITVAIIIETHQKFNSLCSVLEDIGKQKLYQTKIDIYVVDNASDNKMQAYLQKFNFAHIQVLQPGKKLGKSGGFYYGLRFVSKLKYDYIWLLDDDVRLDPLALSTLITTLQDHDEVGLVGSQVYHRKLPNTIQEFGRLINGDHSSSTRNFGKQNNILSDELLQSKPYLRVENCVGKSLLLRHRVVQHIGVFKDYYLQFDDVDLCLRVRKAGWIIALNPSSIVWQTLPNLDFCTWIDYYNECNLYYWQKHRPDLL
ncbi:glycosyltransferase family 2 protein [Nodularia sp. UHCC 0506]|uniref:glycosyltransferase family 2 protein n=1 Tax=Nodularia sp. UHCC 0506 TaxID=3110243 RepID=UPI002B1EA44B|nr:glycosyltransferase family 2 protein [Nodularia sp. UHCC 0506]MEA5514567.1 glycosyltransferase family 2 protein [Nodularia sp. UHCC 0506]